MNYEEKRTIKNNLRASKARLLASLTEMCKAVYDDAGCINRDCDECQIGMEKKELKEKFNLY